MSTRRGGLHDFWELNARKEMDFHMPDGSIHRSPHRVGVLGNAGWHEPRMIPLSWFFVTRKREDEDFLRWLKPNGSWDNLSEA